MEESQSRPLLVAAGIALVALLLLSFVQVDLHRCSFTVTEKSNHAVSRPAGGGQLERELRLWLDAGDLAPQLDEQLRAALAREGSALALKQAATGEGQVTIRVDDASLYTPLYAEAELSAVMAFEARADGGAELPRAHGESRVELEGACYGVVSPSSFRKNVAEQLSKPLASTLANALSSKSP